MEREVVRGNGVGMGYASNQQEASAAIGFTSNQQYFKMNHVTQADVGDYSSKFKVLFHKILPFVDGIYSTRLQKNVC